jgi:prevent-host-death family protein
MTATHSSAPPRAPIHNPMPHTVTATEAKNAFGAVLDKATLHGVVGITKHDEVRAVVLSIEQYRALLASQRNPLAELEGEFDSLVTRMQTPKARAAGRALFDASPERLGRAAVAHRRKRG